MESCPACDTLLPDEALIDGFDRLHDTPGTFEVRVCGVCGTGRTHPLLSGGELSRFYPEVYGAHAIPVSSVTRMLISARFRWHYRRALRRHPLGLLKRLPAGRLLDVGAGNGDLGVVLQGLGWKVVGLEPSARGCDYGHSRGVEMVEGTLETADPGALGATFDVVVFQHSLEHVIDPAEDLGRARALLREGGLLLVSLPNFSSWQSKAFGSAWFHLDLPRHRTHFTAAGLERILRQSGFAELNLTTSTTTDGLPMSLQYRLFGRRRFRTGVSLYLASLFSLALIPLSLALNSRRGGGDELNASGVRSAAR